MGDIMENKIEISVSGVSVTADLPNGKEVVNFYPTEVSSGQIVEDSTMASGIQLTPDEKIQMIETVDIAKTHKPYLSEVELSLNIKEGFKFRIKREPAKIIRYVSR